MSTQALLKYPFGTIVIPDLYKRFSDNLSFNANLFAVDTFNIFCGT